MKEGLLKYLCCPSSGGELTLRAGLREGDEVLEGTLTSLDGREYPIEDGIPNLVVGLDEKVVKTGSQFTREFMEVGDPEDRESKRFRDLTLFAAKTGIDSRVYEAPGFDWRRDQDARDLGFEPNFGFLEGKLVIDAGSGNGRFAALAAPHAREMILLDLGEHIRVAREVTAELGSVPHVRCNLLHLPLKAGVADFAYSIGVIHHTADPWRALREIARTLNPGGHVSVWVYPPEYWGNPVKGVITRRIRKWLLSKELKAQVDFVRRWLLPLGRAQLRVARFHYLKPFLAPLFLVNVPRHEDVNEMLATVIDYYLPEFIWTFEDRELEELFRTAGLSYRRLPFPTAGIGEKSGYRHGRKVRCST
jgi:SAM-dependent methyltransferase/uncharacterized protein YbaR (Trm112 family)